MDYNRYKLFTVDGKSLTVPFIKIPFASSDKIVTYVKKRMRLDMLSYKYYGDANYGWLILQANPSLGTMEFEIPDGASLRIPYPLNDALTRYEKSISGVGGTIK